MLKFINTLKENYNQKQIDKYNEKVDQHIAEMNKGSLIIDTDGKAYRWTPQETGMLFWKSTKLVKVYE